MLQSYLLGLHVTLHQPALVRFFHTSCLTAAKGRWRKAFASQSLTKTEHKYAQIDKEALSIVWGVKGLHVYLYGGRFTLVSDHKPLTAIFRPEKGVPAMTTARLQ